MFKDKLGKVKEAINQKEGDSNNKRKIENLVVFIIILIVTILVINMVWKKDDKQEPISSAYTKLASSQNTTETSNNTTTDEYNLEQDLEDMLSKISGAGNVKVLLTYSESSQMVPLSNENYKQTQTEESDKSGGTRKIDETDKSSEIIYQENNGKKEVITQKVIMPKIEGALILAQGADNANVKTNIIQAVEALTGLATHKIQVLSMQ